MGKALYRKYRSKRLAEIVGQQHITTVLERALEHDKVSHAYLFTGPRGVGKTSVARILAHEVNHLPYDEDQSLHLDIIEIDAASNRRIDDIRELRDKVHVAPTSAKFKVYIIDEVHMLTGESFNALLKTLEEPPAHVIFILATTEMHKLPETIVSRTQHFAFKSVPMNEVSDHLRSIAKHESITIDNEAIQLVAEYGGGSFRDSISLLDQVRNYADKITADTVRLLIGIAPDTVIHEIIKAIVNHDAPLVVRLLTELHNQGIEAPAVARQLSEKLQQDMIEPTPRIVPQKSLSLVRDLVEITSSQNPTVALKLVILQATFQPTIAPHVAHTVRESMVQQHPVTPLSPVIARDRVGVKETSAVKTQAKKDIAKHKKDSVISSITTLSPSSPEVTEGKEILSQEQWSEVLLTIKQQYNTLYGVLRMARTEFEPGILKLFLQFQFHQKRLNDPKNKQIVAQAIETHTGSRFAIECLVGEGPPSQASTVAEAPSLSSVNPEALSTISNIFGGGELLES